MNFSLYYALKKIPTKVISLCDCRFGHRIKGEVSKRIVVDADACDGICRHCGYALYYKKVPKKWNPSLTLSPKIWRKQGLI